MMATTTKRPLTVAQILNNESLSRAGETKRLAFDVRAAASRAVEATAERVKAARRYADPSVAMHQNGAVDPLARLEALDALPKLEAELARCEAEVLRRSPAAE